MYKIKTFSTVAPSTVAVSFTDGTEKSIDLEPLLKNPVFGRLYGKLNDPSYFALGKLDADCLVPTWPDGIDLSPALLYEWEQRLPSLLQ